MLIPHGSAMLVCAPQIIAASVKSEHKVKSFLLWQKSV